jgi:hypothetical protein
MALRMAATTLLNSKTYLGSHHRHLRKQLSCYAAAAQFEQSRNERELATLNSKARAKRIQAGSHHSSKLSRTHTENVGPARKLELTL